MAARGVLAGVLASVLGSVALFPSTAFAADAIYWSNHNGNTISFANLDASAAGDIVTTGATVNGPMGAVIDSATSRIYWSNDLDTKISFANLSGSGGGDISTTGATTAIPNGVAVDPAGGRIYWSNNFGGKISFARLDGTGGGDLNTAGATVAGPAGVAIDPAGGRIYWANNSEIGGNKISFARLDNTGGGDILTGAATVSRPAGVAIDIAAGRIYWANQTPANKISFANLNGSGGGDINTNGATVNNPVGVAVDPTAGKVYWGSLSGTKISFARLDGTGGGDVPTLTATASAPTYPSLFKGPQAAGPPTIGGGSVPGSLLSCSSGSWAPDLLAAFLYRAPASFAYQWSRNGTDIPGATATTYTAADTGSYSCRVTASNHAGSASQTSGPHAVAPAFGAKTLVTLKLAKSRIPSNGPLAVTVTNKNAFEVRGKLSGQTTERVNISRSQKVKLKAKSFRVGAHAKKKVSLKLPKTLGRILKHERKLTLLLTAKVSDPAGNTRTVKQRVTVKLKG
jgi:hypothetical protein